MWFLPILLVGAIAAVVAKRSSARKPLPPSRQLAAPIASGSPTGLPGPISVLGEILRVGQAPPPTVVMCAIAEAQSIGRNDLASDIVRVFVAPLVYHHQRMMARGARPMYGDYQRGSCAISIPRSPREMADASCYAPTARSCKDLAPPVVIPTSPSADSSSPVAPAAAPAAPLAPEMTSMDDEIQALLNSDPARFMDLVSRSGTFPTQAPVQQVMIVPSEASPQMSDDAAAIVPEIAVQMQQAAEAADRTRAMVPGSPIPGIPDGAWRDFVARLERESPQFSSSRHVGQYRQRRERLSELGINPSTIEGSSQAQRTALDADLADAHRHGEASEMFAQHLGRPIALPGRDSPETITMSGVLGVIQCAGLEGAAGWLERSNDRKRFPHTTQAFLHTNGVF